MAGRSPTPEFLASPDLLKAIVDNSEAVIYVKDLEGRYLMVNRVFEEFVDIPIGEIIGKTDHDLFPAAVADAYRTMDRRAIEAGKAVIEEQQVPTASGTRTYLSVKTPLCGETGEPYATFGISTNITDRKQVEHERAELLTRERETREDAEELVKISRALSSQLALEQIVQHATDGATRLTGAQFGAFFYNVIDARGESLLLFVLSGAPREAFQRFGIPRNTALFDHTFRGKGPVRLADVHQDERFGKNPPHYGLPKGHPPISSYLAVPVLGRAGDVIGGLFFGHEKSGVFDERAERLAVAIASQSAIAVDNARLYEQATSSVARLNSQLARMRLLDQITRAIGRRQELSDLLSVVLDALENGLPIDFGCIALCDEQKKQLRVSRVGARSEPFGRAMDLLQGAWLESEQLELARCLRGEVVHEPHVAAASQGFLRRICDAGLDAFVCAPLQLEGKVFGVLIAARKPGNEFSSMDVEFLRQLGEHVALAAHQAQLNGSLQSAYDELRQTQHVVMQHERLRAVGEMASGIAHDINNAISPATLYVEHLLEHDESLNPRAREYLKTIEQAIHDVAETVARLREFYRAREIDQQFTELNLNALVQQVIDLTRARWSDIPQEQGIVIELRTRLEEPLPSILGAETEIRDGLTNLIFNAIDAMPGGGTLSLVTSARSATIALDVIDTGVGMDDETQRRCIEPFFTTKGQRGTGLGLATVYGMVQRHGGSLEIESAPGKGACVRLVFPRQNATPETSPLRQLDVSTARSLKVLVVDDEVQILASLRTVFEGDGHRVDVCDGGQAGIDAFRNALTHGEPYDIVFTDLGMPRVDGRAVSAAIRRMSPEFPIVLLTGWGQRLLDQEQSPEHVSLVLAKPPNLNSLRRALVTLTEPRGSR